MLPIRSGLAISAGGRASPGSATLVESTQVKSTQVESAAVMDARVLFHPAWVEQLVTSLKDAFGWCAAAFARLVGRYGDDPAVPATVLMETSDLSHALSNRTITTSGCFAGVASDAAAHGMITASAAEFLESLPAPAASSGPSPSRPSPLKFRAAWYIEKDQVRQEGLILASPPGTCVHCDMTDFLPETLRPACGLDGGVEMPARALRRLIPKCRMRIKAWYVKHGRRCTLRHVDICVSGSPCTDHSTNGLRKRFDGPQAKFFYMWVALMRVLLISIIVHENVCGFGDDELRELLGDMYVVMRLELRIADLGQAGNRDRQMCLLFLRVWFCPMLTDQLFIEDLDAHRVIRNLFARKCTISWWHFLLATVSEIQAEQLWAANRKGVRALCALEDQSEWPPSSATDCFNSMEREHLNGYIKRFGEPNDSVAYDLGDNPERKATRTRGSKHNTLTAGMGLMFFGSGWIRTIELWLLQGFPVTPEASEGCAGARCLFPSRRTAS